MIFVILPGAVAVPTVFSATPMSTAVAFQEAPARVVGKPLPDVAAQGYDKKPFRLTTLKGRPTLVTFWATWCAPCLKEMPTFQKLIDQSGGTLRVVAVAMQDPWESAEAFVKKNPQYSFLFLHDPNWDDDTSALAAAFDVTALPTNLLVDAAGTVRDYWRGAKSDEEIVARFKEFVGSGKD